MDQVFFVKVMFSKIKLCVSPDPVMPGYPLKEAGRVNVVLPLHPADLPRPACLHRPQQAQGLV